MSELNEPFCFDVSFTVLLSALIHKQLSVGSICFELGLFYDRDADS